VYYSFKKLLLLKILSSLKILLLLKVYRKFFLSCVLLFQLLGISATSADTLNIATASNFRPVLEQLSQTFSEQQDAEGKSHQINISSASSGVIYAQILQGAPFQL
jgi:molybdate transport system substrate-binding protein